MGKIRWGGKKRGLKGFHPFRVVPGRKDEVGWGKESF
jgi:hypothetical protein